MSRRVRITGIKREEPNVGLFVLALLELARQIQAEDAAKVAEEQPVEETA